jgi:hypothetical protein
MNSKRKIWAYDNLKMFFSIYDYILIDKEVRKNIKKRKQRAKALLFYWILLPCYLRFVNISLDSS